MPQDETPEHIAALEEIARTASADALVDLVGDLEKIKGIAYARLASRTTAPPPVSDEGDRLLTAEQAAPLLGLTVKQLRRRRNLSFRKTLGRRTIRYSESGIERWLARKNA